MGMAHPSNHTAKLAIFLGGLDVSFSILLRVAKRADSLSRSPSVSCMAGRESFLDVRGRVRPDVRRLRPLLSSTSTLSEKSYLLVRLLPSQLSPWSPLTLSLSL